MAFVPPFFSLPKFQISFIFSFGRKMKLFLLLLFFSFGLLESLALSAPAVRAGIAIVDPNAQEGSFSICLA